MVISLTAKSVAGAISGMSAGSVTRSFLRAQFQPTTTYEKVVIWLGTMGIGGLVGDAVQERTERKITQYQAIYEKIQIEYAKQETS